MEIVLKFNLASVIVMELYLNIDREIVKPPAAMATGPGWRP